MVLKLGSMLSAGLNGWIRYRRGFYRDFYPFGFAMNGQTARLEAVRQILYECQIKQIIEMACTRFG